MTLGLAHNSSERLRKYREQPKSSNSKETPFINPINYDKSFPIIHCFKNISQANAFTTLLELNKKCLEPETDKSFFEDLLLRGGDKHNVNMITLKPWRIVIENAEYGFTLLVRAHSISEKEAATTLFNAITFKTNKNMTSYSPPQKRR